ncbi:hypothetical protein [Jeongeupia chitinilytica]|uniref:HMA domain-containing protein n=1 Tax=Jeongeupia chitinilytica TaxID=1041641 RepID=A0ABQ3H3C2_9NEIS|nr:hypothetical protein [Jeongeupia chitinilytica]GHD65532.1 hypothetical protein GCM10007350_26140 [Jeongeupia chitinilytica]
MTDHHDIRQHDLALAPGTSAAQAAHAADLLTQLPGVSASLASNACVLRVRYALSTCTLAELEAVLAASHIGLDQRALQKLKRTLAHYADDVERDNLDLPEHNVKTRDVYARVWDQHPHGDHDDTPDELRRYL